jgi:hypothetical protein
VTPPALPTGRPGQALALGFAGLALAMVWFGLIAPARGWYADRQVMMEQRQVMLARMQRLAASLPTLRAEAAARPEAADAGLLPGATDALAAASLQETVQKMASNAGISLTAVETLPAETTAGRWRKVALRISLNAPWPVLISVMHAAGQSPVRIFIGDVHFHSPAVVVKPATQPIQASMVLYGFRPADGGA